MLENTSNITTDTVNIVRKPTLEHTSKNSIPCKTIRPPKTSSFRTISTPTTNTAQPASTRRPSELPPCCRHVLQAKSQTHTSGETPALRKVQHPHNGRTSVSRFPLTKQEDVSQGIRTSFISNLTTSRHDMHPERYQYIWKKHSRRKLTHW